jgi:putative phosphoribosyl transferase
MADRPFRDRAEAGRVLAEQLRASLSPDPATIVLGLPRGGVPVAAVIADALEAPLDVLVVRKVGAPGNPEYGLGAVAEGGLRLLDERRLAELGLRPSDLDDAVRARSEEAEVLAKRLRGDRGRPVLEGRTVVLVDDGVATGWTLRAALEVARQGGAKQRWVAVGVAPRSEVAALGSRADGVVCALAPEHFFAVGEWYEEFPQLADGEVAALLERHWAKRPVGERASARGETGTT